MNSSDPKVTFFELKKSLLYSVFLQILNRGVLFLIGIFLARQLPPQDFGQYGYLISIAALTAIPAMAGVNVYLVKQLPRLSSSAQGKLVNQSFAYSSLSHWSLSHVLLMSLISSIVVMLAFVLGWISVPFLLLLLSLGISLFKALLNERTTMIQANGYVSTSIAISLVLFPCLNLAILFVLYALGWISLASVLVSQVVALIVSILVGVVSTTKIVGRYQSIQESELSSINHYRHWFPFAMVAGVQTLNMEGAAFLTGWLGYYEQLAYLKIALQGAGVLLIISFALNAVLSPKIAYYQCDKKLLQEILTKSMRLCLCGALAMLLFFILGGEFFIQTLFGQSYLAAYSPFVIVSCGYAVLLLSGQGLTLLNITGHEKLALKITLLGLIINGFLLINLVPSYQAIGAATSMAMSFTLQGVLCAYFAYKKLGIKTWVR
ncbi:polysaccharide biosynthesis C-terminal domain-containing protein [Vibrio sp. CK2-1]|uniref:oligosaccharide flippase family protein n=1 Tax=Vibrio sp. CK2-1 TaxID=2912249 RepID=UPI001F3FF44A|nr:polysaccharide biosynthesis C-terminal domain-containing protein [Vibrio sp. CK2-1]MCF7355635.1 polysaccharide biosynthesis C-terminal domain-containing protein [Vibrio sp. CK2-1]